LCILLKYLIFAFIPTVVSSVLLDLNKQIGTQKIFKDISEYEIKSNSVYSKRKLKAYSDASNEHSPHTYLVRNTKGKICILAKFLATFTILYSTPEGKRSSVMSLPSNAISGGRCGRQKPPILQISWPNFRFIITFFKIVSEKNIPDQWAINSVVLFYNTSGYLFDGAINKGMKTAKSDEKIALFEAVSVGKSYYCPASEAIAMYNSKKVQVVTVKLSYMRIQPYKIKNGMFSEAQNCSKIRISKTSMKIVPLPLFKNQTKISEDSSNKFSLVINEPAPLLTFPVWNKSGKICILAKFIVTLIIVYSSKEGEKNATIDVPSNAKSKGRCGTSMDDAILNLFWLDFQLAFIFTRIPFKNKEITDNWVNNYVELTYNTAGHQFIDATNARRKTVKSMDDSIRFETPIEKSYYCLLPEIIPLYDDNNVKVATLRLIDARIQPYGIINGTFSEARNCSVVQYSDCPKEFVKNESIPIIVGNSLTVLVIAVILCYSLYKSMTVYKRSLAE
ncbi:lysosome-associated membrane glycoprotein 1-like, partial [Centruroides vittatus]|uniref:lysosome-associated membrane glycoprotein 1-like n=1 Tax=Centruroides vittatus TaxID=120091 RepID=UPI00350EACFA